MKYIFFMFLILLISQSIFSQNINTQQLPSEIQKEFNEYLNYKTNQNNTKEIEEKEKDVQNKKIEFETAQANLFKLIPVTGFLPTALILFGFGKEHYTTQIGINSFGYASEKDDLQNNFYVMPAATYLYSPKTKKFAWGGSIGLIDGKGKFDGAALGLGLNFGGYVDDSKKIYFGIFLGGILDQTMGVMPTFLKSELYKSLIQYTIINNPSLYQNYSTVLQSNNPLLLSAYLQPIYTIDPQQKTGLFGTIGFTASVRLDK